DARTVAAKRAALEGAVAVYGSATPRPESWARLERLDLGERIGASLPPVRIVDMRREAGYPLSAPLLAELGRVAERGGKATLLLPDFRAEERTFQLLTQLAGRSGRDAPGRVLIQTFQPDSRAIELAGRHDVPGFLAGELERREALGYPPYRHLVRIVCTGPDA